MLPVLMFAIGYGLGLLTVRLATWLSFRRRGNGITLHKERREMWIARDRHHSEHGNN